MYVYTNILKYKVQQFYFNSTLLNMKRSNERYRIQVYIVHKIFYFQLETIFILLLLYEKHVYIKKQS